tara:strand:- start:1816 stop:2445 length:630 start_codon:yes stop_codon:yes gene_type:complete
MALNTLPAGAFADSTITSAKLNLANNFAFTGTVSGAGYDLLHTISASGDTTITFNSTYITSAYKKYIVSVIDLVPGTDAQHLKFLASTDNFTGDLGSYQRSISHENNASSGTLDEVNASANMDPLQITGSGSCGSATGEGACFDFHLFNPAGSLYKNIAILGTFMDNSTTMRMIIGSANITSTSAVNAIRFFMASGTIASGTFKLFGVN